MCHCHTWGGGMLLEVYKGNDPSVAHSSCVLSYIASKSEQASTLTQNGTCRTSNTGDLLVLQNLYWSYNFFFNIKRKNLCIKITDSIYFYLFYLHLFQKYLGYSCGETCLSKCPQIFTGPVGPVEVFFTGSKPFLGIFTGLGP